MNARLVVNSVTSSPTPRLTSNGQALTMARSKLSGLHLFWVTEPSPLPSEGDAARSSQTGRVRSRCARQHTRDIPRAAQPALKPRSAAWSPDRQHHALSPRNRLLTLFPMRQEYGGKGKREKEMALH